MPFPKAAEEKQVVKHKTVLRILVKLFFHICVYFFTEWQQEMETIFPLYLTVIFETKLRIHIEENVKNFHFRISGIFNSLFICWTIPRFLTKTQCITQVPAHMFEINNLKNSSNHHGAFCWWISDHIRSCNFRWPLWKTINSTGRTPSPTSGGPTQTQNLYSTEKHSKMNSNINENYFLLLPFSHVNLRFSHAFLVLLLESIVLL